MNPLRHLLPVLTSALLACSAANAADLRIGMAADITAIDPHAANITPNNQVGWHVFEALTHVDENARLVPGLALSWRAVDPLTWEFKLRPKVRFHDGSPFEAADAIASIERARKLPAGQFAGFVQRIVSTQAVDTLTLRVKTASAYAMVPYDLNSIFIIPRRLASATSEEFSGGAAMVGTGPFRFARFARGDRVELARNDAWWGGKPDWDRVVLRILPNDPARTAALLAGDVDLIEQVPTADLGRLRASSKHALQQKPSWRTIFLHLDQREKSPFVTDKAGKPLDRNPLRDLRVRTALSMAVNRAAMVERVMEGAAVPASNLVAPGVFGHEPALKPAAFDADGAKKLLAEAGWPDGFGITVHAPNNRYVNDDQVAQALAQMFSRIGVATRVETLPANVYFTRARNFEFSVALLGWGSFSGDLALRSLVATPIPEKAFGTWNWSKYSNPRVDQLLDQGFAMTDEKKREAGAREAMALAMRDVAVLPLHHQVTTWAMTSNLAYAGRTDEFTLAHKVAPRR